MKKQFVTATFLISILVPVYNCFSQGPITDNNILYNKKPSISSPNAAALEKFVEFPTANYTGVPDISLQLFILQTKAVKVPISLSYHAGGIKIEEVSSDVGIGWALSAGGSINIINNGLIDEISGFPFVDTTTFNKIKATTLQSGYSGGTIVCEVATAYSNPIYGPDPYYIYPSTDDYTFLRDVVEEQADAEPDIYAFNFLGRSGKFISDQNGVFRTIPYSELKIERIIESSLPAGYKITDETGNIYEFKVRESSTELFTNSTDNQHTVTKYSRSYYLSKVTTSDGETINFYYSGHSFSYDLPVTYTRARTSTGSSCWQLNTNGVYFNSSSTSSSMSSGGGRIDSIKGSDGTLIKFLYSSSDRTDMPGSKSLDTIQMWKYLPERVKVKETRLLHDYSTGRLTLTSIHEEGIPPTTFTYNSTGLPDRLSYSKDHYGYNNQRSNTTPLPLDEYIEFWDGADRSIDTNYIQAGILKKITHPTGGATEYIYEANQYYVPDTTIIYPKVIGINKASFPDMTVIDTFYVPSNARKIRIIHTDSYDGTVIHNDYCIIHLTGPNSYSRDFIGNSLPVSPPLDLAPGQYILSIENVGSTYSAEATIFWFEETNVPPHNEIGGGVRIKEIRKNDSTGNSTLIKKFQYTLIGTTKSSGKATFAPIYIDYVDQNIRRQGDGTAYSPCTSTYCQLISQSSNSLAPLAFGSGNLVSYSEVTTYIKDTIQNGFTNYKYNIEYDGYGMGIPSFPYAPRIMNDWVNGILLEQTDYAYIGSQFKRIKKTKNTYNYTSLNTETDTILLYKMYGAKIGIQEPPFVCYSPCVGLVINTWYSDLNFGIQYYNLYSSWHHINKTEDTLYDNAGVNYIATATNYYYDNSASIQPTRIQSRNSKGDTIIQKIKYPRDYSPYGFVLNLLTKNAVALSIEKYVVKKDINNNQYVLNGQITTYKNSGVLADKIYAYETSVPVVAGSFTASSMNSSGVFSMDNAYKEKASFIGYDNLGNIRELQKTSDIKYSYIWDYLSTKPIAEVANADTSSIAYTSFEADSKGGWTFSGTISTDSTSPTGIKRYSLSGSHDITKSGLTNTAYVVSYWSRSGNAFTVNGSSTPTRTGKTIDSWTYFEHEVSGTSITISGSNYIDEIRLYPKGAQMITYTYTPLIGMTSQCDAINRITYYEYDSFGRLKLIKDQDKNVIKVFDYQYKQSQNQ